MPRTLHVVKLDEWTEKGLQHSRILVKLHTKFSKGGLKLGWRTTKIIFDPLSYLQNLVAEVEEGGLEFILTDYELAFLFTAAPIAQYTIYALE